MTGDNVLRLVPSTDRRDVSVVLAQVGEMGPTDVVVLGFKPGGAFFLVASNDDCTLSLVAIAKARLVELMVRDTR